MYGSDNKQKCNVINFTNMDAKRLVVKKANKLPSCHVSLDLLYPLFVLCLSSVETKNEAGEVLCVNQFSTFVMGAGGFGGKRSSPLAKVCFFIVCHHFSVVTSCKSHEICKVSILF